MGIRSILAGIFGSNDEHGEMSPGQNRPCHGCPYRARGGDEAVKDSTPGQMARDRLNFILIGDRANISPGMMDNMKQEIIELIKKYVEIDETQINLALESEAESVALVANIPIKTVSRRIRKD